MELATTQRASQVRGKPSTTIYSGSKPIRTGRKAVRYDNGLAAHRCTRPHLAVDGSHARPTYRASVRDRYRIAACKVEHARYDGWGNLKSQTEHVVASGRTETFTYDPLHRLVTASRAGLSSTQGVSPVHYEYDAAGNITRKSDYANVYTYPTGTHAVASVSSPAPHPHGNSGSFIYLCSCQPQSGLGGDRVKGASAA
jgi:YD repeat-containing protein